MVVTGKLWEVVGVGDIIVEVGVDGLSPDDAIGVCVLLSKYPAIPVKMAIMRMATTITGSFRELEVRACFGRSPSRFIGYQ